MPPPSLVLGLLLVAASVLAAPPPERREPAAEVGRLFEALRRPAPGPRAAEPSRRRYVVVRALTAERRAALEAAGLAIELPPPGAPAPPWRDGEVVQGLADTAAERRLRALDFVLAVEEPGLRWTNAGLVTSGGAVVHRAAEARATLGTTGAGVAVGVISDGVVGLDASIASGDLPIVELPAIPGVSAGGGSEGTALLELVHDVAPGARLLFASPATSAEMVAAIEGLAAAGAAVLVDDLVFTDEPKFEDGPIAAAARRFVAAGGLYVTAAGNFARSHWYGAYRREAGRSFGEAVYAGVHAFAAGDFGNSLRIPAGGEIIAVLQWNEPFGRAAKDFDLLLGRSAPEAVLAGSVEPQDGAGHPFEALRFANTTGAALDAYLAVGELTRVPSPEAVRLNLVVFSRGLVPLEHAVRRESVFGHAAVEEVLAVAAADVLDPGRVEDFSSGGPATVFFPARAVRQVPRLTAVNRVETAVGRRGQFANPFVGTSAAAPHVAGCAALLLAAGAAAPAVVSAMTATALDLEAPGFDLVSGAGLLDCAAAARLLSGRGTAPSLAGLAARFGGSGALEVTASGVDADGDARTALVRILDRDGAEVARRSEPVTAAGPEFTLALSLRGAPLARARAVAVGVVDAVGLAGPEAATAVECPQDGTLGDLLCALGDLIDRAAALPARDARRVGRPAGAAAAAVTRAGLAAAAERPARVRRALRRAGARLGAVRRAARRAREPEVGAAVAADALVLRSRLRALRASARPRAGP